MNLTLAIDTATSLGSVALVRGDELIAAGELGPAGGQAERILAEIDDIFHRASLAPADLDLVAVTIGPGSFTGLRIGLAAAQGIAFGNDLPIAGVPTTLVRIAWARKVSEDRGALFVGLLDARKGEFFLSAGTTRPDDAVDCDVRMEPARVAPEALIPLLAPLAANASADRPVVLCGDGVPAAAPLLVDAPFPVRTVVPSRPPDSAHLVAQLGRRRHDRHEAGAAIEPLYLREPDARKPGGR